MLKARVASPGALACGARSLPQACDPGRQRLHSFQPGAVAGAVVSAGRAVRAAELADVPRPVAAPFIGVATLFQMRVYRMVTRFMGTRGITLTAVAVGLSALYWGLLVYFSGVYSVPRSVVVLYPVLATALIWLSRQIAGSLLRGAGVEIPTHISDGVRTVLIYGAGTTGVQLLEALEATRRLPAGRVRRSAPDAGQAVCLGPQGVCARAPGRARSELQGGRSPAGHAQGAAPRAAGGAAAARAVEGPRAHAAGHRGRGGRARHRQRSASCRGRRPARARPRAARHLPARRATSSASRSW